MTIIPQSGRILDYMKSFEKQWCVYQHWIGDDAGGEDKLLYVGSCKLTQLFNFPDARRNSEWLKTVTDKTVLTIYLTHTGERSECFNERGAMIQTYRPHANINGVDTTHMVYPIVCNETGQKWNTQSDCARELGINAGQLSQHLLGRPGFVKVQGYTFRKERG